MAGISAPNNTALNGESNEKHTFAFSMLTALFFMIGFLTSLNDILIPHLKIVFDLNYFQASLIQFMFFSAYFLMSLPSGKIIGKFGYQKGIVIGLLTSGTGAALFIPAAILPSYPVFLIALFTLASGFTILQVAINPYVAILGPSKTASSRLNLSQAFNSLGTTIAPWLGGILILSAATISMEALQNMSPEQLMEHKLLEAASVKLPYLLLSGCLFLLALLFTVLKLPIVGDMEAEVKEEHTFAEVWKVTHLKWGVLGIFVYVGAEVSIGSYLVNFIGLPDIAGLMEKEAATFVSYYWGGAMIGRFVGSALMQKVDAGKLLGGFAGMAFLLTLTALFASGNFAMIAILSIGLFNSIMFPTIFTLAIHDLGAKTGKGSSLLIMAIVGGAILPVLMGIMADTIGLHTAFFLPAICYVYIAWFGLKGSHVDDKI